MQAISKSRVSALAGIVALVAAVACVDSPSAPQVNGKRALKDTTVTNWSDTLQCKSGWVITGGRVVCNPDM